MAFVFSITMVVVAVSGRIPLCLGKLLAAYANHPNVGGITILSLGCQHLQSPNFGWHKKIKPWIR